MFKTRNQFVACQNISRSGGREGEERGGREGEGRVKLERWSNLTMVNKLERWSNLTVVNIDRAEDKNRRLCGTSSAAGHRRRRGGGWASSLWCCPADAWTDSCCVADGME